MRKSFDTFKKNAKYVHKVNQDKLSQSKVGLNKLGDTYGIYPAGGYAPIEDLKKVEAIGEFAVKEHNKQAQTHLKFEQVVKGERQIVAGTNFNLILRASIEEQSQPKPRSRNSRSRRHWSLSRRTAAAWSSASVRHNHTAAAAVRAIAAAAPVRAIAAAAPPSAISCSRSLEQLFHASASPESYHPPLHRWGRPLPPFAAAGQQRCRRLQGRCCIVRVLLADVAGGPPPCRSLVAPPSSARDDNREATERDDDDATAGSRSAAKKRRKEVAIQCRGRRGPTLRMTAKIKTTPWPDGGAAQWRRGRSWPKKQQRMIETTQNRRAAKQALRRGMAKNGHAETAEAAPASGQPSGGGGATVVPIAKAVTKVARLDVGTVNNARRCRTDRRFESTNVDDAMKAAK
ncbi:hypothetical protein Scep_020890 [Stephania cephalantha]|uniref:Cystatin domain-containing protein n=1 Tax=Stephania cephalantha TaxID=152367 RepID=A0AAP0F2D0_9MAGN